MGGDIVSKILGKVIADSSPEGFSFVSTKKYNAKFVLVITNESPGEMKYIGEIINRQVINPYFDSPTSIRYINENDEPPKQKELFLDDAVYLDLHWNKSLPS